MMTARSLLTLLLLSVAIEGWPQSAADEAKMEDKLLEFFYKYKPKKQKWDVVVRMLGYDLDNNAKRLTVKTDDALASVEMTPDKVSDLYKGIRRALPKPFRGHIITVTTGGVPVQSLVPAALGQGTGVRYWGNIDYKGNQWVSNASLPVSTTLGLQGRHIALWASHGRYYDVKRGEWRWQRPRLFGTCEDLFTPSLVVPYLIPMLENAGATVFTPRERDFQRHEVIVDNDVQSQHSLYLEVGVGNKWESAPHPGFAMHAGNYSDGENPFVAGTARVVKATKSKKRYSLVSYQPNIPEDGEYAVYVSYQTLDKSVDDACYTVWHKGVPTEFRVNQRMGGGTWVYLGTFNFGKGCSEANRVVLTNQSGRKGVVTADAVRFGGGMGNIERGGTASGMPRAMEGARYYAQWAGMPRFVYGQKGGNDDYADDINTRGRTVNHLAGGSCYMPNSDGLRVPIELSLAIHSDAGYSPDLKNTVGTLAICTTGTGSPTLDAGISRLASRNLANTLLNGVTTDLRTKYGAWNSRGTLDRNYSETRLPGVPSVILETLSHQNFPDMRFGHDPNFKFTLARAIYKSILRYIATQHGLEYCVAPLTPSHFSVETSDDATATLRWQPTPDDEEPTAFPTAYIVYTKRGQDDFDNGTLVRGATSLRVKLDEGVLYSFRVVAVTRGGRSFPTEELCAMYRPESTRSVLIVNGFHRLSPPAMRLSGSEQGFDLDADPGVSLGRTTAWVGRQLGFDTSRVGIEDEGGLGWTNKDFEGMSFAGNDFNYVRCHAEAMAAGGVLLNISSCTDAAVEDGSIDLSRYAMTDLLLGLERSGNGAINVTSSSAMQARLRTYSARGGALFASGAYMASDAAQTESGREFLANVLGCASGGTTRPSEGYISGMGTQFGIYSALNEEHYCAPITDTLLPVNGAFATLAYSDGTTAAVALKNISHRAFVMGFPFECIKDDARRTAVMRAVVRFLLE